MSRIDDLIRDYCPAGVEWDLIGDRFAYQQPTMYLVESTNYVGDGTKVLTAGQTFVLGHTQETEGVYEASAEHPVIIFDDFTTNFQWVDFPFKAKSSAMKMITARSGEAVELRFLYHWMATHRFIPTDHARHWISVMSQRDIPRLPLPIQQEIVRILDTFTALEAELEAELEARTTQYEETRNRLMSFYSVEGHPLTGLIREFCPEGVSTEQLSALVIRHSGTAITATKMRQLDSAVGEIRVFAGGNTVATVPVDSIPARDVIDTPSVIVKSRGNIGFDYFDRPFTHKSELWSYSVRDSRLNIRFLFHYLQSRRFELHALARSKSVKLPQLSVRDTDAMKIPLPAAPVQDEIVRILDAFDSLVSDLTLGLPAEIAARRKQYEYYRDKLLSFESLAV